MSVTIGNHVVQFSSVKSVMDYLHRHGYILEPTRRGVRAINPSDNSVVFEY